MDSMAAKAKKWIDEKKDPRSAHWQAGIEAVMELFMPDLDKGRLTPVCQLKEEDISIFKSALAMVDLSPGLLSAFLPPSVADSILPPDSVKEWERIEKGKPSYKIIIMRPGKKKRILCAEISEYAHRPGVDIFQSGAFLGNFDYETYDSCISELPKIIRAHAWEKEKWQEKDYLTYTLNWFEKIIYLGKADVIVDRNHSFFHSPTLIKTNRIDALFLLLYDVLIHRFREDAANTCKILHEIDRAEGTGEKYKSKEMRFSACEDLAENYLLDLLNLVRTLELLDFTSFTNTENQEFQNEFVRTVRKVSAYLDEIVLH